MGRAYLAILLLALWPTVLHAQESGDLNSTPDGPPMADRLLFPAGMLSGDAIGDIHLNHAFSRQLIAMQEGPLADRVDDGVEVYRMLVLPTWTTGYAVRIEHHGDGAIAFVKVLDGAGGFEPGTLVRSEEIALSEERWALLSQRVVAYDFFNAPTEDPDSHVVRDGTMWIFEGARNGRHHVVHRSLVSDRDFHDITYLMQALVRGPV